MFKIVHNYFLFVNIIKYYHFNTLIFVVGDLFFLFYNKYKIWINNYI